jgi:hypothetical protein
VVTGQVVAFAQQQPRAFAARFTNAASSRRWPLARSITVPGIGCALAIAASASRHSGSQRRLERHIDAHRDGAATAVAAVQDRAEDAVDRGIVVIGLVLQVFDVQPQRGVGWGLKLA